MSNADGLSRISGVLDAVGIPYMLVGSFASSHYGAVRSTADIDIVINATLEQVSAFINQLPVSEFYRDLESAIEACRRRDMFNVLDTVSGFKIDLIFLKPGEFYHEAFRRRRLEAIDGTPIFVSSPEDVIIAKLEWARMGESLRQIEDVSTLVRKRWTSLDHQYLNKWIVQMGLTAQWEAARKGSDLE